MQMKEKKQSDVSVLLGYAGSYKGLTYLGLVFSAVAMILGMLPYICIWLVVRDLIAVAPNWTQAVRISRYGWMAFAFSFAGIAVYFCALMCTHLAAFRTASNIRKAGMEHLMKIVVLADGKVAEQGSPEELFACEDSIFRRMAELQNSSAGWSIKEKGNEAR